MAKAEEKIIGFEGKVRNVVDQETRKEDEEKEISRSLIRDEDGVYQVIVTTPKGALNGLVVGGTVKVSITNPQTTLTE